MKYNKADAENFLNIKDIYQHIYLSDPDNKKHYEVTELMAEFANKILQKNLSKKEIMLKQAYSQLLGFKYGKWEGDNIIPMIDAMGITKAEWDILKEEYEVDNFFDEEDIKAIDDFFKKGV